MPLMSFSVVCLLLSLQPTHKSSFFLHWDSFLTFLFLYLLSQEHVTFGIDDSTPLQILPIFFKMFLWIIIAFYFSYWFRKVSRWTVKQSLNKDIIEGRKRQARARGWIKTLMPGPGYYSIVDQGGPYGSTNNKGYYHHYQLQAQTKWQVHVVEDTTSFATGHGEIKLRSSWTLSPSYWLSSVSGRTV